MLNYIWIFMILFSFICAVFNGTMSQLSSAILESCSDAVSLCIKLLGSMCLWCGIMNVAEKSGLCDCFAKMLSPILKKLFPDSKNDNSIMKAVSMNVAANVLGLGNAATPLGIRAVKEMNRLNPDKQSATLDMMTFVVINTAALKIVPSTVATLRSAAGAENPMDIILCVWVSSAFALASAVVSVKLFGRFSRK